MGLLRLTGKWIFLIGFGNILMPDEIDWLLIGDFNFIRKPEDRNRPGGNALDMLRFNDALSSIGVVEIPLHGKCNTPGC